MAKRNTLRQEYYKTTGNYWKTYKSKAEPTIEYCKWLENKLVKNLDLGCVSESIIADISDRAKMWRKTFKDDDLDNIELYEVRGRANECKQIIQMVQDKYYR